MPADKLVITDASIEQAIERRISAPGPAVLLKVDVNVTEGVVTLSVTTRILLAKEPAGAGCAAHEAADPEVAAEMRAAPGSASRIDDRRMKVDVEKREAGR